MLKKVVTINEKHSVLSVTSDINRFEKSIKKTPVRNFSSQIEKRKTVKVGGKDKEIYSGIYLDAC